MPVIALSGSKGGVGTTLVAANLALALNQIEPSLIVEATAVHGSLDLQLGLVVKRGWVDLEPLVGELDIAHVDKIVTRHPCGLRLLVGPPTGSESLSAGLIRSLARLVPFMVLDLPIGAAGLEYVVDAVPMTFLLVATPDLPSIRASQRWVTMAVAKGWDAGLVVNQWTLDHPLNPAAFAENLRIPLAGAIPFAPEAAWEQVEFGRAARGSDWDLRREVDRLAQWCLQNAPGVTQEN